MAFQDIDIVLDPCPGLILIDIVKLINDQHTCQQYKSI